MGTDVTPHEPGTDRETRHELHTAAPRFARRVQWRIPPTLEGCTAEIAAAAEEATGRGHVETMHGTAGGERQADSRIADDGQADARQNAVGAVEAPPEGGRRVEVALLQCIRGQDTCEPRTQQGEAELDRPTAGGDAPEVRDVILDPV